MTDKSKWNEAIEAAAKEAEQFVLSKDEAQRLCEKLELLAAWDKVGSAYYSLKRQLACAYPSPSAALSEASDD